MTFVHVWPGKIAQQPERDRDSEVKGCNYKLTHLPKDLTFLVTASWQAGVSTWVSVGKTREATVCPCLALIWHVSNVWHCYELRGKGTLGDTILNSHDRLPGELKVMPLNLYPRGQSRGIFLQLLGSEPGPQLQQYRLGLSSKGQLRKQ